MSEAIDVRDLTEDEVATVKGIIQNMRRRHVAAQVQAANTQAEHDWSALSVAAFAEDWDNDKDAIYDNWRELYGVPER